MVFKMSEFEKPPKDRQEEILRNAAVALDRYCNDIEDCGAGYNILRYARMGLFQVKAIEIPGVKTNGEMFEEP